MPGLENYLALVQRVDELCGTTHARFQGEITCHPGCDACCRHLSVFAVEGAALAEALRALPEPEAAVIRETAVSATAEGSCPLLKNGLCLLYRARPIICRTHGLPLLISRDGESGVDFCPENFKGLESIPGSAVIDLERMNSILAAVNSLFLQSFPGPERLTVAEALRSTTNTSGAT
jgi:uncharacterized protein